MSTGEKVFSDFVGGESVCILFGLFLFAGVVLGLNTSPLGK